MEHIPFIIIILVFVVLPVLSDVREMKLSKRVGTAAECADDLAGHYIPYHPPSNLPKEYTDQYRKLARERKRVIKQLARMRYDAEYNNANPIVEPVFGVLRSRRIDRLAEQKANLEQKLKTLTDRG